ncbi:MAG: hypothetical protein IPK07_17135 [Deltaproteobacteria bacterium]|nr:hypothetical protein [Deltaproteobacteria bacterium]
MPRPPESELPDLVKDLTATATRGAGELRWSIPQKNQDGSKPADVVGFQVLHSLLPVGGAATVTASKPELAFVLPVPTDPAGVPLKEAVLRDTSAVADTVNVYRVVTYGSTGYGTIPSNAVSIAWSVPPAPPGSLTARASERAATLSWTAPTTRSDASAESRTVAYRVYRWAGESEPELLTATPVLETTWTDSDAPIDRTQNYVVRSVVQHADVLLESDDSSTVSIVSEDTTPPATPTGLVGARTPAGIELRWDPSPDADVAGYNLYRLRPNGAGDRVTPNLIDGTRFLDSKPPLGDVRYRITAVDRSARANESPPSATVTVR